MTQVTFSAATTPQLTDLDANFTELYGRTTALKSNATAVGIGVTPSAWAGVVSSAVDLNGGGAFSAQNTAPVAIVSANAFFGASGWTYKATGTAAKWECGFGGLGQHAWFVAASGTGGAAISWTQAMTLDISGNLLVTATTAPSGVPGDANGGAILQSGAGLFTRTSANAVLFLNNKQTGAVTLAQFYSGGATVGSISSSGTTTAYNTSSDYRLKDNPVPITGSGAFIDALKPCTWTWKSDGSAGAGFIAHELQAVSPASVTGTKDAVDADGAPVYQAVEYGSAEVIAMLVAEVKSLRARLHAVDGQ
jgi:hypothetical protein